jgi:hypothetical protein
MELFATKMFYDNRYGLVELEDDVLSVVSQVRELYGNKVKICLEPTTGHYVFSENSADGTERLIFTSETLDARCLTRLIAADSTARGYTDAYDAMEREQDEFRAREDDAMKEQIRDHAERLTHALKKDGAVPHHPLQVNVPKEINA